MVTRVSYCLQMLIWPVSNGTLSLGSCDMHRIKSSLTSVHPGLSSPFTPSTVFIDCKGTAKAPIRLGAQSDQGLRCSHTPADIFIWRGRFDGMQLFLESHTIWNRLGYIDEKYKKCSRKLDRHKTMQLSAKLLLTLIIIKPSTLKVPITIQQPTFIIFRRI